MTPLFDALTKYGPVTLERHADQWRVGCLVTLPARVQESFIATYNRDLSEALKELLKNAYKEKQKLWEIQRAPKQGSFFYGTESDYKELI